MKSDWVAGSARARSMAGHRVGAGASRSIASLPNLDQALAALRGSSYAGRLGRARGLAAAERALQETVLWQLRVLAGWLPASGTALARAAAATFEIENIASLARQLDGGPAAPEPFRLGALATAWPRIRRAGSREELARMLRSTPWGDPGSAGQGALRDVLTVAGARRLAAVAAPARPWCGAVCVLTAARILTVDGAEPDPALRRLLRPVLGTSWEAATDLAGFASALPLTLRPVIRGLSSPRELWRAEARARGAVESDGFRLLRGSLPGPDVVLGAAAVLSVDAWRVGAALASAAAGAGSSEVLDEAA